MPKQKPSLTPLELEIMKVLWESGPANVQAVQQNLGRDLAYTTVQTMLNILCRKGHVKRTLKQKAYVYRPSISRTEVVKQTIGDVVERFFGGSATSLVMSLVETKHLKREDVERLRELLDAEEGK